VSRTGQARVSLAAGIAVTLLGGLLCLDQLDVVSIHDWATAGWSGAFIWPVLLAFVGATLLWAGTRRPARTPDAPPYRTRIDPSVPVRPAKADPEEPDAETRILDLYRGGFGIALVIGAALLFLTQIDALGAARDAAFTAIVAIFALALILAPFIWRLGRNLAEERAERVRSQERAEVAAHLHDSVLQTLTLMQKRANDPREVAALARRQERELRDWLAGDRQQRPSGSGGFATALRIAAEEVEDAYLVQIEVVTVGDRALDEPGTAVIGAAREALTNAAKFAAEGGPISVYAEVGADTIEAFVRDRGPGFDPGRTPADRRGVRESIVGRMQRHGGTATIASVPGAGTEVALRIEGGGE
jgi:signal transduction histidine kinase